MTEAEPLVRAEEVWYAYGTGPPALRGVSVQVRAGERVALIGRNGSGKTTLAKHLNGLLRPQRGRVVAGGLDTSAHDLGQIARVVGYVFQNPDHQLFSRTVREELAFGPRNVGLPDDEVERRVEGALAEFGLAEQAETPPALLGFAQRRLVAVAAVVTMGPAVLVLDEPFAGMGWSSVERLAAVLRERVRAGQPLVLITHQMRAVAELAERCVVLDAGTVLVDRPVREVLTDRDLLARAALGPPAVVRLGERLRPQGFSGRSLTVDELVTEYVALSASDGRQGATRTEDVGGEANELGRRGEDST
jgi:energy-coupling factor transporter ATP-binding protein EcfA2